MQFSHEMVSNAHVRSCLCPLIIIFKFVCKVLFRLSSLPAPVTTRPKELVTGHSLLIPVDLLALAQILQCVKLCLYCTPATRT